MSFLPCSLRRRFGYTHFIDAETEAFPLRSCKELSETQAGAVQMPCPSPGFGLSGVDLFFFFSFKPHRVWPAVLKGMEGSTPHVVRPDQPWSPHPPCVDTRGLTMGQGHQELPCRRAPRNPGEALGEGTQEVKASEVIRFVLLANDHKYVSSGASCSDSS